MANQLQDQKKAAPPQPVQYALAALKILEAEDAALAAESRKKLPGFARRLAEAGEEVTVEGLLASARAREIDPLPKPKQQQYKKTKTYEEIVAAFSGGQAVPVIPAAPEAAVDKSAYEAVQEILGREFGFRQHEERNDDNINRMACNAAGLFGTQERVLQYLEKWGTASKYPLHDIIKMIKLPPTQTPDMDLTAWGNAVLNCGPSMALLVKFADRVAAPQKSDDGHAWSMKNTRAKVAAFVYKNGHKNPELAALCMEHGVEEKYFDQALVLSRLAPAVKNIPDITIAGENFGMPGATFHRLAANDVRALFLGEITDCCQSISGGLLGPGCAQYGFLSQDSGFYVVENAKGRIVGQTWAWRGKDGELVFDSLETLGGNVTAEQWQKLTKVFKTALAKKPGDVTAFHIGIGGRTPGALTKAFEEAASPPKPLGHPGYPDSLHQVVVWAKQPPKFANM